MIHSLKIRFSNLLLVLLIAQATSGEVRLPGLVGNGMILQRETPVNIWGWANVGEKVRLGFNHQSFETTTGPDGMWQVTLPAQKSGGPFDMEISATNQIRLKNILFGDVWLCSGQSNMEYPMSRLVDRYAKEIAACENNNIRQFKVPQKYEFNEPLEDYPNGRWETVNPTTMLNFSAVAYFFARDLFLKDHVPIGIINATLGGSPAEAWMSAAALKDFPACLAEAEKFKDQAYIDEIRSKEQKAISAWYEKLNRTDQGLDALPNWKDPGFDASSWPVIPVPGYWADHGLGEVNGVVWFRKWINLPASFTGNPVWIQMGRMVDADSVFINGKFIGTTSYQYPQRKYAVPEGVLKAGKNCIVVRLISNSGRGGFVPDKPYQVLTAKDTVDLKGEWQFRLGCTMPPTPGSTFVQWKPTGLYNGMIAPANNYEIKGIVWYQGESNADRYQEYQKLLTSLITDWRLKRNQEKIPFIVAQLPNYMEAKAQPSESSWAKLRNAQLKTAETVENTILTVNIDLGDWNDIHPQNKSEVGRRLALAAEALEKNHKKIAALGPTYRSMKIKGNKIELTFANCADGLVAKDGKELKQFAIAGANHVFEWAKAEIKGNKVWVWSENIADPVVVRYAWADNPQGANLFDKGGLPASPFTTDNSKGN
jgi:sialate O-acetylesterase